MLPAYPSEGGLRGFSKITGYLFWIELNAYLCDLNVMVTHEAQTGATAEPSASHTVCPCTLLSDQRDTVH